MTNTHDNNSSGIEQHRYACILGWGAKIGFVIMTLGFVAYVSGLLPSQLPFEQLPQYWGLPLESYLQATGTPTGWGWFSFLHYGDYLSLAGIAILASCSIPCLVAVAPFYARRGDVVFIAICLLQVVILLLAASGLVSGGH